MRQEVRLTICIHLFRRQIDYKPSRIGYIGFYLVRMCSCGLFNCMPSTFGDDPRASTSKWERKDVAVIFLQCTEVFAEVVMKPSFQVI